MSARPGAVVLLSGGVDSSTTAAHALAEGYDVHALSLDYGQRHRVELEAARRVARRLGITDHLVVRLDMTGIGGSALTVPSMAVPKGGPTDGIPITYVPARNTIFLSYALGWAEVLGVGDIFIGANAVDYSGYPDCRPEYIAAFEAMANLATRASVEGLMRVRIMAPLIGMSKAQIIRLGRRLGLDYSITVSCYDPGPAGEPCGLCDSCRIRDRAMREVLGEGP